MKSFFDAGKQKILIDVAPRISELKNTLREFYNQPGVQKLLTQGSCVLSAVKAVGNISSIFTNFKQNLTTFLANQTTKAGLVWVARYLLNFICKIDDLKLIVNSLVQATRESSPRNYYYWGKGVGKLIQTLASAAVERKGKFRKFK